MNRCVWRARVSEERRNCQPWPGKLQAAGIDVLQNSGQQWGFESLFVPQQRASPLYRLAPEPVPGTFFVPLRGGSEVGGAGSKMLPCDVLVESHTKAGSVRNVDPTFVDHWRLNSFFHQRGPPWHVK